MWRKAADHLLREAGVQVLYHSTVTGVLLEGDRVPGLALYTKQGRPLWAALLNQDNARLDE